jgi:hypothetical protein
MKLRKQAPAKAALLALTAALLAGFFALFHANPGIDAATEANSAAPDYDRFFAPNQAPGNQPQAPAIRPHTRTRAS